MRQAHLYVNGSSKDWIGPEVTIRQLPLKDAETAKNLFKKGGSAATTLGTFLFASTNLVVEIGIVIYLLLGWQFLVTDVVGGFMLIGLMAFGFVYLMPDKVIEQAREDYEA